MGMTIKEALENANKQLSKKIDDAMTKEVFSAVQEEEAATIDSEVYGVYTPYSKKCRPYRRRGDLGGLADPSNIEIEGGVAKGGTLIVVNKTEPNPGGVGVDFLSSVTIDKNLPYLIEYGGGKGGRYDFAPAPTRRYLKPRPFTAKTVEHLRDSGAHIDALKIGLQRQGVKVK